MKSPIWSEVIEGNTPVGDTPSKAWKIWRVCKVVFVPIIDFLVHRIVFCGVHRGGMAKYNSNAVLRLRVSIV
jgi:hypothetical protein